MTKKIRIENADTSSHPVRVTVQTRNAEGAWADSTSRQIDYPTQMIEEYVHAHQRIVIEELGAPTVPDPA